MATPQPQGREHSPTADHGDQTPRSGVVCSASSRADVATPSPPPPSPASSPASTPTKSVRIHVLSYSKQQQQQHQTTTLDDDSTDYDVTGIEFDEEISLITPSFYSFIFFGADFDESIIRWRETDGTASGHIPFDFRLFLGCLDGNQFFFKLKKKNFSLRPPILNGADQSILGALGFFFVLSPPISFFVACIDFWFFFLFCYVFVAETLTGPALYRVLPSFLRTYLELHF